MKHKAEGRRETVLLLLLLLREEEEKEEEAWCENKSQLEKRSSMKSVPQAEDTLLAHMMILVGLQCSRKAPVVVAMQRALSVCVGEKRRRGKRGQMKEEEDDDSEQVWGSTPTRNR